MEVRTVCIFIFMEKIALHVSSRVHNSFTQPSAQNTVQEPSHVYYFMLWVLKHNIECEVFSYFKTQHTNKNRRQKTRKKTNKPPQWTGRFQISLQQPWKMSFSSLQWVRPSVKKKKLKMIFTSDRKISWEILTDLNSFCLDLMFQRKLLCPPAVRKTCLSWFLK